MQYVKAIGLTVVGGLVTMYLWHKLIAPKVLKSTTAATE